MAVCIDCKINRATKYSLFVIVIVIRWSTRPELIGLVRPKSITVL
jgi:hypothetical protein